MIYKKSQKGAVILIYVAIITMIATLLLVAGNSRILLSIKRNQSVSDNLISVYEAESKVNDFLARLAGGYVSPDAFPITQDFDIQDTLVTLEATGDELTQTITVTSKRDYSVNILQAIREVSVDTEINSVDIILALDCTGSMNRPACPGCVETRIQAQKDAALNFVNELSLRDDSERFRMGVEVFGIDVKWLLSGGQNVTPVSGLSHTEVKNAITNSFGTTRENSTACQSVMDGTSVGSAYDLAHRFFAQNEETGTKQVEVVITDGEPNSRIPHDYCDPDVFCSVIDSNCDNNPYGWNCISSGNSCREYGTRFLSCTLADSNTYVPTISQYGLRNPDVDAYAVTVLSNPPGDVVHIFNTYTTPGGYFNATQASELSEILENVLEEIINSTADVNIRRIFPNVDN